MNARVPIFETDGLLQDALAKAARPAPGKIERATPADTPAREELYIPGEDLREIERRARALRAEAIADLFARFFRAIERWMWRIQQRDLERYLAKATDNADLERRLREFERSSSSYLVG